VVPPVNLVRLVNSFLAQLVPGRAVCVIVALFVELMNDQVSFFSTKKGASQQICIDPAVLPC